MYSMNVFINGELESIVADVDSFKEAYSVIYDKIKELRAEGKQVDDYNCFAIRKVIKAE